MSLRSFIAIAVVDGRLRMRRRAEGVRRAVPRGENRCGEPTSTNLRKLMYTSKAH